MNERDATEDLNRLLDTIPDTPAPLIDLLAAGERARTRHRRRRVTLLAAAAVAAISLSTVTVQNLTDKGSDSSTGPGAIAPDPAGAAEVVRDWLLAIQATGPKSACMYMTADYQRAMPAFQCDNAQAATAPPYLLVDLQDADLQVISSEGDSATVQVTLPGTQTAPGIYLTHYDRAENHWLVSGHGPAEAPSAIDGTWTVTVLVAQDGRSLLPDSANALPTLTLRDGRMGGETGGCNSIFGKYRLDGPDLTFAPGSLGTTLVGCEEAPVIQRLADVRHVSGSQNTLYLYDANWTVVAELRRDGIADPVALAQRIANEELRGPNGDGAEILSATAIVRRGTVRQPNIGPPCTSGQLLEIKLIGSFPHVTTTGGTPSALVITADARSGHACLLGVSVGTVSPEPGAFTVPLG